MPELVQYSFLFANICERKYFVALKHTSTNSLISWVQFSFCKYLRKKILRRLETVAFFELPLQQTVNNDGTGERERQGDRTQAEVERGDNDGATQCVRR